MSVSLNSAMSGSTFGESFVFLEKPKGEQEEAYVKIELEKSHEGEVKIHHSEIPSREARIRSIFHLSITEDMEKFGPDIFSRQPSKVGENRQISLKDMYKFQPLDVRIDQDKTCVLETNTDSRPYALNLSYSIAVLIRTFTIFSDKPKYLSVSHVWTDEGCSQFHNTLTELIEKANLADIEIFLCGGYTKKKPKALTEYGGGIEHLEQATQMLEESNRLIEQSNRIEAQSNRVHEYILRQAKMVGIPVVQDLVGLVDAGGTCGNGHWYEYDFYIYQTGFDKDCNPYALVDVGVLAGGGFLNMNHPDIGADPSPWKLYQ